MSIFGKIVKYKKVKGSKTILLTYY